MLQEFAALARYPKTSWARYRDWNQAICEHFFGGEFSGRPVYVDLDDDVLDSICQKKFGQVADPTAHLRDSVKATLDLASGLGRDPFSEHVGWGAAWKRSNCAGFPPFAALLGYFSQVADSMVASEDFASTNYYGRLVADLKIAPEYEDRIMRGYGGAIKSLWPLLNSWLDSWNGALGYPTARPLDHRVYVSVSISQALVRDHDRKLMRRMFGELGLTPAQNLQASEMSGILLHWASAGHQHTSLARLLRKGGGVLNRVAEVATAELQAWTGQREGVANVRAPPAVRLSVVAELRSHPVPKLELFLSSWADDESLDDAEFRLPEGAGREAKVAFALLRGNARLERNGALGLLSLEPWSEIRAGDALLAQIELEGIGPRASRLQRMGQPLCVMVYRDEEGLFREVPQAPLMARLLVLSHDSVAPHVNSHLEKCARPGFRMRTGEELAGLPSHWIAFSDVHIASRVEAPGLEALVPLAEQALILSGGVKLSHDTWLSCDPPEVLLADTSGQRGLKVRVSTQFGVVEARELELGSPLGAAAYQLMDQSLKDGDYEVTVGKDRAGGGSVVLERAALKLRSSDMPRPEALVARERLGHSLAPDRVVGMLTAAQLPGEQGLASEHARVMGATIEGVCEFEGLPGGQRIPDTSQLGAGAPESDFPEHATATDTAGTYAGSCVARRYHVWQFATVPPDAETGYLVEARCSDCHAVIWQKTGRGRPMPRAAVGRRPDLRALQPAMPLALPPLTQHAPRNGYVAAVEALNYWRAGRVDRMAPVIGRADDSPWAVSEYFREMSSLCHLDVETDRKTWRLVRWSIAPTCLLEVVPDCAVLTGFRSRALLDRLHECAMAAGGRLQEEWFDSRIPIVSVRGMTTRSLQATAESLSIKHAVAFPRRLVASLPNISWLVGELQGARVPSADLERFDLRSARWVSSTQVAEPGAYKSRWRGITYFFVPRDCVQRQQGYLADARTVKHLAASELDASLMGYLPETRQLVVPMGCELPGLLDRVAVMCSGRPPVKSGGMIHYQDVPLEIAEAIRIRLL